MLIHKNIIQYAVHKSKFLEVPLLKFKVQNDFNYGNDKSSLSEIDKKINARSFSVQGYSMKCHVMKNDFFLFIFV